MQLALRAAEGRPVEVEVRQLDEFRTCMELGVERVLLDHWTPAAVEAALALAAAQRRRRSKCRATSRLDNIRAYALPGVQYLSVGALTHSAPVLDLSLLSRPLERVM